MAAADLHHDAGEHCRRTGAAQPRMRPPFYQRTYAMLHRYAEGTRFQHDPDDHDAPRNVRRADHLRPNGFPEISYAEGALCGLSHFLVADRPRSDGLFLHCVRAV